MSAFISMQSPDEICLLTDGAGYDNDGYILTLGRKVTIGKVASIAVTTRGRASIGEKHQRRLCDAADRVGVDMALYAFEKALPTLASRPENGVYDYLHWHICAWSETRGLVRYSAHNLPQAFSDGEAPLRMTLCDPQRSYSAANNASMQTLMECGVSPWAEGEGLAAYMERAGASIMEAQRRTPATPLPGAYPQDPQYLVGGQWEMTVVAEHGVRVTTLRTWPDKLGEKIAPFSEVGNVVRLPRAQRRAMEAAARKMRRSA